MALGQVAQDLPTPSSTSQKRQPPHGRLLFHSAVAGPAASRSASISQGPSFLIRKPNLAADNEEGGQEQADLAVTGHLEMGVTGAGVSALCGPQEQPSSHCTPCGLAILPLEMGATLARRVALSSWELRVCCSLPGSSGDRCRLSTRALHF